MRTYRDSSLEASRERGFRNGARLRSFSAPLLSNLTNVKGLLSTHGNGLTLHQRMAAGSYLRGYVDGWCL